LNAAILIDVIGYPAAALAVVIETMGVPFPGDPMLFAIAAWTGTGHRGLLWMVALGFLGADLGAGFGYLAGRHGGRPVVERFGSTLRIRPDHLARAELFFARHGDRAVLVYRFIPGLRMWCPLLAGMAHMPFWRFQLFSAMGNLAWAALVVSAGYFAGSNLAPLRAVVRNSGGFGIAVLVIFTLILLSVAGRRVRAAASQLR
jgi:membrane protein DedA with SNARE-associated domain